MSDENTQTNATPKDELRRYITDSNIPKNECEWWAHHEIDRLSRDLAVAHARIQEVEKAFSEVFVLRAQVHSLEKHRDVCARDLAAARRKQTTVISEIAAERKRQIEVEGWSVEHDDEWSEDELAEAAACYALHHPGHLGTTHSWPLDTQWWKPKDKRRDLIRAAALIVAEIERLDRLADPHKEESKPESNDGGKLMTWNEFMPDTE